MILSFSTGRRTPDLNPIMNCLSYVKRRLKGNSSITSLPKPMEAIKLIWVRNMGLPSLQKLADSMPRRLQTVID
jgi:hypothetical protein